MRDKVQKDLEELVETWEEDLREMYLKHHEIGDDTAYGCAIGIERCEQDMKELLERYEYMDFED